LRIDAWIFLLATTGGVFVSLFFLLPPLLIVKNRTPNQWNNVKVQYVGFEGIYDLDLLQDEILE